ELLAQRLDDDFLRVVDTVHHQSELAIVGLEHDDVDDVAGPVLDLEFAVEVNQRQQVAAQPIHGDAVNLLDAQAGLAFFQANQFQEADLGNGVTVAGAGDDQRGNDGQRQGNLD